jgi:hypothetical protein
MRTLNTGAIAAAAGAFVLGVAATGAASAADLPQSYQPPYQQGGPPPAVEPGYAYPPPVAYGYQAPPVVVVPRPYPYYAGRPWPIYRPYGAFVAHGYGHYGRPWGGYRHW